uniref:Uncharacterized protein n=1 Tax=Leptobrachium leishanense TaxID=445787 RepID=A0A8C5R3J0_9ANUR
MAFPFVLFSGYLYFPSITHLLFSSRGLALHSKPELLRVLEKRRSQWKDGQEDSKLLCSPLEQELQKWQQRREEVVQQNMVVLLTLQSRQLLIGL